MALTAHPYSHDGVELIGQLARPSGPGPHPGILIAHEIDGLGQNVRRRAEMLAELGYVAFAADNYGGGIVYEGEASRAQMDALRGDPDRLRGRMAAGLAALRAVEDVDPDRVAAIGYCFGGLCVLELARSGADLAGVVSFHGLLTPSTPAAKGAIRARVLACTGDADPLVPREQVTGFEAEMSDAGADWQVIVYGGAKHAFSNPGVAGGTNPALAYDASADRQSWAAMRTFLNEAMA